MPLRTLCLILLTLTLAGRQTTPAPGNLSLDLPPVQYSPYNNGWREKPELFSLSPTNHFTITAEKNLLAMTGRLCRTPGSQDWQSITTK